ncbi:MAG: hypothetical protein ACJ0BS_01805 [Paracoccaceae bacterium]
MCVVLNYFSAAPYHAIIYEKLIDLLELFFEIAKVICKVMGSSDGLQVYNYQLKKFYLSL